MTDGQVAFAFLFALVALIAALITSSRRPLPILLLLAAVAIGAGGAGFVLAHARIAPPPPDESLRAGADAAQNPGAQLVAGEVPLPNLVEPAAGDVTVAVDQFASTTGTAASATNALALGSGGGIVVAGWAYDVRGRQPCRAMLAIVDRRHAYQLRYGLARADVAAAYHDASRAPTGYQGTFGADLARGAHAVRLACVESGDRAEFAPGRYIVVVR